MAEEDTPEPVFENVEEFVVQRFLPVYTRPFRQGGIHWCAQWWRHPEAISRFQALWHAWEVLRLEHGTGLARWYRDHLDPMADRLFSPTGPFHACTPEVHNEPEVMPSEPTPPDWFDE